ncbi:hypothetical protein EDC04DRAFT_2604382 [Pisolithus marmoratus]|nr:hypothetical protein EDC04DRAFT_2604382 [Pisolithus marmoratus]
MDLFCPASSSGVSQDLRPEEARVDAIGKWKQSNAAWDRVRVQFRAPKSPNTPSSQDTEAVVNLVRLHSPANSHFSPPSPSESLSHVASVIANLPPEGGDTHVTNTLTSKAIRVPRITSKKKPQVIDGMRLELGWTYLQRPGQWRVIIRFIRRHGYIGTADKNGIAKTTERAKKEIIVQKLCSKQFELFGKTIQIGARRLRSSFGILGQTPSM